MPENVGFTVEPQSLQAIADRILRTFVTRDYDVAQAALSASEEDPFQRLYTSLHSASAANALGYADPELIIELQVTAGEGRPEVVSRTRSTSRRRRPSCPSPPRCPSCRGRRTTTG
ncbi:hypothetical protein QOZ88_04350 [Blastococcus sp. BMG 814]|uniref:Uncharacterized protein n=1 Tax=Blastococcus carthaginiensis TaxID=3050034 RepID=A0ABT9I9E5_9ACTN|nr:hypothetical protein [Blastococcus carthaginiensis]MDP5181857.1 hypothetical protein [Blastococcus carthaginiensis]